jgi:hypothetical protein
MFHHFITSNLFNDALNGPCDTEQITWQEAAVV